jgi:hypothetical protein
MLARWMAGTEVSDYEQQLPITDKYDLYPGLHDELGNLRGAWCPTKVDKIETFSS